MDHTCGNAMLRLVGLGSACGRSRNFRSLESNSIVDSTTVPFIVFETNVRQLKRTIVITLRWGEGHDRPETTNVFFIPRCRAGRDGGTMRKRDLAIRISRTQQADSHCYSVC